MPWVNLEWQEDSVDLHLLNKKYFSSKNYKFSFWKMLETEIVLFIFWKGFVVVVADSLDFT